MKQSWDSPLASCCTLCTTIASFPTPHPQNTTKSFNHPCGIHTTTYLEMEYSWHQRRYNKINSMFNHSVKKARKVKLQIALEIEISGNKIVTHTGRLQIAGTWFGYIGSCSCLPLLPQLACNILATSHLRAPIRYFMYILVPDWIISYTSLPFWTILRTWWVFSGFSHLRIVVEMAPKPAWSHFGNCWEPS